MKRLRDPSRIGDLTVTPTDGAYLISRLLERPAQGPWWEFVAVDTELDAAVNYARQLAKAAGSTAWVYKGGKFKAIKTDA